jgi:hypothetical protein
MIYTGEYDKSTQIGYDKAQETRNVGDVWEDQHHRYEKKEGYILKTGKNSEALQEIRDYIAKKSECKNPECKTIRKSEKDRKMIQQVGYCLNCNVDREHGIRVSGFWEQYENYRMSTKMIVYGKQKLEELKQSLDEVKPYYEYINEDGTTERWELPQSVEETKADIQNLIEIGTKEIQELEKVRNEAFDILKENNLEHYL